MIPEKSIPSVNDFSAHYHKPPLLSLLWWQYGYINALDFPIARKNRITGEVQVRKYIHIFQYWTWFEVNDKYKSEFLSKKYW